MEIARIYSMTINTDLIPKIMLLNPICVDEGIEEIDIHFPRKNNLLFFNHVDPSHKGYDEECIQAIIQELHFLGNLLHSSSN
jgi:hypothetical protein